MTKKQLKQKIKLLENSHLELKESNKQKSDFIVNISHELKTPLNSIIGFSSLLLKNKDENINDKQLKFLQSINSNGKKLSEQLTDLIELSKIEVGKLTLHRSKIDVILMINNTIQLLQSQVNEKACNITFINELDKEELFYTTDEHKIQQLFIYIITHILQSSIISKGKISISLTQDKQNFIISLCDKGIEINKKELKEKIKKQQKDFAILISKNITKQLKLNLDIKSVKNTNGLHTLYLPKKDDNG